jgi:hypothetical protein
MGTKSILMDTEAGWRFRRAQNDLPHHHLVSVVDDGAQLAIVLYVGEDTTSEELRAAIPAALRWRDRLLETQGPWMGGGDNEFLESLHWRHEAGKSYRQIADSINSAVARHLANYLKYTTELAVAQSSFKSEWDAEEWLHDEAHPDRSRNSYGRDHAEGLLHAIRLKGDIGAILDEGLKRLAAGAIPFENEYPVDRSKVLAVLDAWRSGTKHLAWDRIQRQAEADLESKSKSG